VRGTHGWCRRRPPTTLLRAALRYASHGWPVVPGTFAGATEGSHACRRVACLVRGAHPAVPDWPTACTVEPGRIAQWWARDRYLIVLPTGIAFDALEVPADLGAAVRQELVRAHGGPTAPIALAPNGRWQVLVSPGARLRAELADRAGVMLHGLGSWVAGPPSPLPTGAMRWLVPPQAVNWTPADAGLVQWTLTTFVRRRTR